MRALYRCAVATVLPSRKEGYGLPLDEALASGGRVIASDLDVFRDRLNTPGAHTFDLDNQASFDLAMQLAFATSTDELRDRASADQNGTATLGLPTLLANLKGI